MNKQAVDALAITGATLKEWGLTPSPKFPEAIAFASSLMADGLPPAEVRAATLGRFADAPVIPLRATGALDFRLNIAVEGEGDAENIAKVAEHMVELMRVPTIKAGAVMPDACPSDIRLGTIPVGGVVATENAIHPGMHSADICCSMALSIFSEDCDPGTILDAGMKLSHFGPGGRSNEVVQPPSDIMEAFRTNSFLRNELASCAEHFATQGDGNHFFYVGRLKSSGAIALVTHHGSRKPGAMLYKGGMAVAEQTRRKLAPEVAPHNAWIIADSREGRDYWSALQIIRKWTKASHYAIHDRIAEALSLCVSDRFWNEHNFVFQRSDGLFYHAKGATPSFPGFAADDTGLTLIPLNMAAPILIAKHVDATHGLGFAPHGAGRNMSRSAYMRQYPGMTPEEMFAEQTKGIDARSFCGIVDASELPGAYKSADQVRRQIVNFGLAKIVDEIAPYGSIMAGDWQRPFKEARAAKKALKAAEDGE